MTTADEIVDAALGIDAAQIARIDRLCEQAFPGRASTIGAQIRAHAKLLHTPSKSDEENIATFRTMTFTKGAEFTRATPTPETYVALAETEAKQKGMEWAATQRLAALRKAQAMTPEDLLSAVPISFAAPKIEAPVATNSTTTDTEAVLDAEIERRFGLQPGAAKALSALDRIRFHAELRKQSTPNAAPAAHVDLKNPVERIAAARRAAAAK
jgi:hypothetical protein